jgi:hypothetical protein
MSATRSAWPPIAVLAVVAMVASACLSAAPSASSGVTAQPTREALGEPTRQAAAPGWEPRTPFQTILERISPEGHLSKEDALSLFVTVFGPVPGVAATHDPTGVRDGTLAIRELMRYRDELRADQLEAIQAHLAPPADAEVLTVPPVGTSAGMRLAAGTTDALKQALEGAKDQFRRTIAQHVGDFDGDVNIHFRPNPATDKKKLLGQAWSNWPGGVFDDCDIYLFPDATSAEPLVMLNTLAHEMFHCFQFAGYGTLAQMDGVPAWIIEGQAEWVGNVVGGVDASDYAMWDRYLMSPGIPLTQRSYDAIGFYSHLDNTGTDPWTVFRAMWVSGGNSVDAFRSAGADREEFLGSWPSGVFREPDSLGAAWDTTGPGITPGKFAAPRLALPNGGSVNVAAPFFANGGHFVSIAADVVHVEVDGHARLSDGTTDTTHLTDSWFCVAGKECACPSGAPLPVPVAATLAGDVAIAVTGGTEGTVGSARGVSRDELCSETPKPSAPTPKPTEDEFCRRYRAFLAWQLEHAGTDYELSQPWAGEIESQMQEMRPHAPAQLTEHVDLYIRVYGTYASAPEPINVPIVGPEAAGIASAFLAMSAYCGISGPGDI